MRALIGLCILSFSFVACKKEAEPVFFEYQIEGEFTVRTNLPLATEHALPVSVNYNPTDSFLLSNGYTSDQVDEILIDSIYISTNDSIESDLNFLQALDLLLEGDEASKMLVGTTGDLPNNLADTVGLSATTRDVKGYLLGDSLMIWPELILDQTVLTPTKIKVVMDLTVEIEG